MAKLTLSKKTRSIVSDSKKTDIASVFLSNLQRTIEIESRKSKRVPSKTFSPSSLVCPRLCYYKLTGAEINEEVVDYTGTYITDSGTFSHDNIQGYIEKMAENGIDCIYYDVETYIKENNITDLEIVEKVGHETKLRSKKYNLSFMTDGILKIDGEFYLFEHKSEASFKHNKRVYVDESHYNQAYCYSLAFGINKVIFTYQNRDFGTLKSYLLEVTDENRQSIIDLIEYVNKCEKEQIIPNTNGATEKTCRYCNYSNICPKDRDEIPIIKKETVDEKPKRQSKRKKLI